MFTDGSADETNLEMIFSFVLLFGSFKPQIFTDITADETREQWC